MPDTAEYYARNIQVLEGLEPVRKRPELYVGNVRDGTGLLHVLSEFMEYCLDEFSSGHLTQVELDVGRECIRLEDNGRGLPVQVDAHRGEPAVETIFSTLFGGQHLQNLMWPLFMNALSDQLVVHTARDGHDWRIVFGKGKKVLDLQDLGPTGTQGTRIELWPDRSIWPDLSEQLTWLRHHAKHRLRSLAGLGAGVRIRSGRESYCYPEGLGGLVFDLAPGRPIHREPVVVKLSLDDVDLVAALLWTDGGALDVHCWAGLEEVVDATTTRRMSNSLTRGLAASLGIPAGAFREVVAAGLTVLLRVTPQPAPAGGRHAVYAGTPRYVLKHEVDIESVVGHHLASAIARELDRQPDLHDQLLLRLPARL